MRRSPNTPRGPGRAMTAVAGLAAAAVLAAGCSDSGSGSGDVETITSEQVAGADTNGTTIRLVTHDSFTVTDGLLDQFTAATGITVDVVSSGDAGELVSKAILTAGQPEADVLFGIDNTFLQRGLDAGLFEAYASPALADVPDEYELDPQHRVTPVDYGDVCVNYWKDGSARRGPAGLDGRPGQAGVRRQLRDPGPRDVVARASPSCWPRSPPTATTAGRATGRSWPTAG